MIEYGLKGCSSVNLIEQDGFGIRFMFVDKSDKIAKNIAFRLNWDETPSGVAGALERAAECIRAILEAE